MLDLIRDSIVVTKDMAAVVTTVAMQVKGTFYVTLAHTAILLYIAWRVSKR